MYEFSLCLMIAFRVVPIKARLKPFANRHQLKMKTTLALIFTAFLWLNAEAVHAADDCQFIAPGAQLPEVIAFLEEIIMGYENSSAELANIKVAGSVIRFEDKGAASDTKASSLAKHQSFLLVQKNGLGRYEQDYFARSDDPTSRTTAYRLMAKDGFYKLDGTTMYILPRTNQPDEVDTWANLNGAVLNFEEVFDGTRYVPLVLACRSFISQLKGESPKNNWDPALQMLVCSRKGSLMTVAKSEGPAVPENQRGYVFSFIVDASKGYRLIQTARHAGGEGRGLNYAELTELTLQEFYPGVFFPKTGSRYVSDVGNVAKAEGQVGASRNDFVVDELLIRDFEYDESRFEMASLPIPKGTQVEDQRVEPALIYQLDK